MKKLIAFAAILAFAGTAYAEGDGNFTHNAEYRVRYQYDQNVTGDKDTAPTSQDNIVHRFKFGTTFKASEKLSATLTLLHNAEWGSNDLGGNPSGQTTGHSPTGDGKGIQNGTNDGENMLLVHEAYGNWVVSDDFNLKFGRGNAGLADGALIGENDWQATPYAYEGVLGTYEHESFQLQVWGVRFAEWNRSVNANHDDDPEANSFGLAFDFKSLPEFLNMANVHILQNNNDEVYCGTGCTVGAPGDSIVDKASIMRYGVALGGETAGVDYKVNYEAESGETEDTGTTTDKETMMYQVELGYSLPEVMNSRFYVLYHSDSGTGSGATKNETYDPYFYELHANAGLMDVVKWGNLTYISVGYTLEPMEDTMVGIHYHMFSRTEKASATTAGANGSTILNNNSTNTDDDKIGDEIDLTATKKYEGGFAITARAGMFMPGDVIKNTGGAGNGPSDTYTQVFLEGKMSF